MPPTPHVVVHHRAKNDRNGNPRRVFAVYSNIPLLIGAYDEEYLGESAIPAKYQALPVITVFTSVPEYKALVKLGEKINSK
jgi:hypothetical protein